MKTRKFTQEHEWIYVKDDIGVVGISDFAQGQLGEVVYVELPIVGASFKMGDEVAIVESNKAASEVFAPIDGKVVAVNQTLEEDPSIVNSSPEELGWFFKIKITDESILDDMMDSHGYKDFIKSLR